jgi:hypothetical protein
MTMNTTTRFLSRRFPLVLLAAAVVLAGGCEKEEEPLTLAGLTGGESLYVERMVLLERAKTVALVDRVAGDALLDSLAAAWGDSSLQETMTGVPSEPLRAANVAQLLRRIIAVEQESLKTTSGLDRLSLPLSDPPPLPAEEEPEP